MKKLKRVRTRGMGNEGSNIMVILIFVTFKTYKTEQKKTEWKNNFIAVRVCSYRGWRFNTAHKFCSRFYFGI